MLYFPKLLGTSIANDFLDGIKSLTKVLLLAQALSLQDLGLDINIGLIAVSDHLVVVPSLDVLSFVECIDGIVVVVLGHEGLGKGDVHVDLK